MAEETARTPEEVAPDWRDRWQEIHPSAAMYYGRSDDELLCAKEWAAEWEYEGDEHNYCHFRSTLVALIHMVERTRALANQYDIEAKNEGYGGELWSTTAAAIHAALDGTEPRKRDAKDGSR